MRIGILALQGAFAEHKEMLNYLGVNTFEIRRQKDLSQSMNGIIIPGGESTVIGKLLNELDMINNLRNMIKNGLPVFGTCAGLILLAENITEEKASHLGTMDITAKRNAYGRQLGSFYTKENFADIGKVPMTFIRAPYISKCGKNAKPLAIYDGKIVAASQDNQLVTAFHPELNNDTSIHRFFLENFCSKY